MKTKPNKKKIIEKSEKKVFSFDGIWTHTPQGKRIRSDALACMATADWWLVSGFLTLSTYYKFPLIANFKRERGGAWVCYIATDRQSYDLPYGVS